MPPDQPPELEPIRQTTPTFDLTWMTLRQSAQNALEDSKDDVLAAGREGIETCAAHALCEVDKAIAAQEGGDSEGAWYWLTRASFSLGAARAYLNGAWVKPAPDHKALGSRGGKARKPSFAHRRASAAKAFLALGSNWATQTAAISSLERVMEANGLASSAASRTDLYKAHPEVKKRIGSLPLQVSYRRP